MDLYELVDKQKELVKSDDSESESTLFFIGPPSSGKSTLIQGFLKPNSKKPNKSTFSLEYNFARRKNPGGSKSLAHIWELGGDIYEEDLLSVPISPKTLPALTVVICVDLSKPQNILINTNHWLDLIRKLSDNALGLIRADNAKIAKTLRSKQTRMYEENPESGRVKIITAPIVIMATKWDSLKTRSVSTADRRLIFQVLRYIAHYNGASLFCSGGVESTRSVLTSLCFGGVTSLKKNAEISPDKPISIVAGTDSYAAALGMEVMNPSGGEEGSEIGSNSPPRSPTQAPNHHGLSEALPSSEGSGPILRNWQALESVLEDVFGKADPLPTNNENNNNDESTDENIFPEPAIDEERQERAVLLNRYVAEQTRKDNMRKKMNSKSAMQKPLSRDDLNKMLKESPREDKESYKSDYK